MSEPHISKLAKSREPIAATKGGSMPEFPIMENPQ
jgi:hypothetical protein